MTAALTPLGFGGFIGQASLLAALLLVLAIALLMAGRWFGKNRERLTGKVGHLWQSAITTPAIVKLLDRHPRTRKFLAARFARGEYLGLHLTIGLVISIAGLWLFLAVAEDVITHDPLTLFDLQIFNWLHSHTSAAGAAVFTAISALGSPLVMLALAAGVGVYFMVQRKWIILIGWVAAFLGGILLDGALKWIIRRPRPVGAATLLHHLSWSFPSGHAMGSLIGYGMLAYMAVVFWIPRPDLKIPVVITCVFLVVAVGVSRLYLGVHFFSDVIGGYAAGLLWLSACISGLEVARKMHPATPAPVHAAQEPG